MIVARGKAEGFDHIPRVLFPLDTSIIKEYNVYFGFNLIILYKIYLFVLQKYLVGV